MNLCACGCGTAVSGTWKRGHISRVQLPRGMKPPREPWESIPKTVDTETGCLRWGGTHHSAGYGLWGRDYAHRVAWERENGPIPEGLTIDHVWDRGCRWRDCVLTAHMEPVTQSENARRSRKAVEQRERTHCPQNHEYTPENTRWRGNKRGCRQCDRDSARRQWLRKKESA